MPKLEGYEVVLLGSITVALVALLIGTMHSCAVSEAKIDAIERSLEPKMDEVERSLMPKTESAVAIKGNTLSSEAVEALERCFDALDRFVCDEEHQSVSRRAWNAIQP